LDKKIYPVEKLSTAVENPVDCVENCG